MAEKRSEEELRQLAQDVVDGHVFGSWMLSEHEAEHMLQMVFMPLFFMGTDVNTWLKMNSEPDDPFAHMYEYMEKAGPRSINGKPIFMSCQLLRESEAKRLGDLCQEAQRAKEAFLAGARKGDR